MANATLESYNVARTSQSAFVRGFIDGVSRDSKSFPRPFSVSIRVRARLHRWPMRGIGRSVCRNVSIRVRARLHRWRRRLRPRRGAGARLNPRSCAASSMARPRPPRLPWPRSLNPRSCAASSMASTPARTSRGSGSLNPRSCAASSMARGQGDPQGREQGEVSIRVRARLHRWRQGRRRDDLQAAGLNPRSCAASSMAQQCAELDEVYSVSQSAFVRGFIDGEEQLETADALLLSQSAFVRGFIDGGTHGSPRRARCLRLNPRSCAASSMAPPLRRREEVVGCLNPRSCAASSMAKYRSGAPAIRASLNPRSCAASSMAGTRLVIFDTRTESQSAFVRGFIDGERQHGRQGRARQVSIRVRARLHRWPDRRVLPMRGADRLNPRSCAASSMARCWPGWPSAASASQSAFVRGFIDGARRGLGQGAEAESQSAFVRGFIDGRPR